MATATNWSGKKWAMMIASDGNTGTNTSVYYWRMPFPKTLAGPITVEWDWQYFPTNPIPAGFNPSNSCPINEFGVALPCTNDAGVNLQTTDVGFTLADSANANFDGNPNVVFNELCTPTRFGGDQVADARFNGIGECGGGGDWFKKRSPISRRQVDPRKNCRLCRVDRRRQPPPITLSLFGRIERAKR